MKSARIAIWAQKSLPPTLISPLFLFCPRDFNIIPIPTKRYLLNRRINY